MKLDRFAWLRSVLFLFALCLLPLLGSAQVVVAPLPLPRYQFFDASGRPIPAGKLCSYAAGTTTPLPTYSDSTGGTPNSNPLTLDAGGAGTVWLDTSKAYKLALYSGGNANACNGSLQWTQDNVVGEPPITGATIAPSDVITKGPWKDIRAYGCKGDGVADDTACINAWVADVAGTLLVPKFGLGLCPGGIYRVTSQIMVPGGTADGWILSGTTGWGRGPTGCRIYYDGAPLSEAVIRVVGGNNSIIQNLAVDTNAGKALYGIHLDSKNAGVFYASSGMALKYVSVTGVEGVGSVGIAIGNVDNSQTSEVTLDHPNVSGGGAAGTCESGIKTLGTANVKNFSFYRPVVDGCQVSIDWTNASGYMTIEGIVSANQTVAVIKAGTAPLTINGGETESNTNSVLLIQLCSGNPGSATIQGFSWQASAANDANIITSDCALTLIGNSFQGGAAAGHPLRLNITGLNPGSSHFASLFSSGNFYRYATHLPVFAGVNDLVTLGQPEVGIQSMGDKAGDIGAVTQLPDLGPGNWPVLFSWLGSFTPINGAQFFCTDCQNVVDDGATAGVCVAAGHGTYVVGQNGAWRCNIDAGAGASTGTGLIVRQSSATITSPTINTPGISGGSWIGSPKFGSGSSDPVNGMRWWSATVGSDIIAAGACVHHDIASTGTGGIGSLPVIGNAATIAPTSGYIGSGWQTDRDALLVGPSAWMLASGTPATLRIQICNASAAPVTTNAAAAYNGWILVN